jgi:predicted glutamine amidotransferase
MFYQKSDFLEFVTNFYNTEGRYPNSEDFSKKYLSYYQVIRTFGSLKNMYNELDIPYEVKKTKITGDKIVSNKEIDKALDKFLKEFKEDNYIIKKVIIRAKNIRNFKVSLANKLQIHDEFLSAPDKTVLVVISACKKVTQNEIDNIFMKRHNVVIISAEEITKTQYGS